MIMLGNEWGKKLWQNERRQQEKSWRKERKFLAQEKKYQEEDREEIVLSPSSSFCSFLSSPSTLFSSCTFFLHWLLYTFNTGREQVECLLKQMEERETKKILWKQDKERVTRVKQEIYFSSISFKGKKSYSCSFFFFFVLSSIRLDVCFLLSLLDKRNVYSILFPKLNCLPFYYSAFLSPLKCLLITWMHPWCWCLWIRMKKR